ncbi:MAG: endonuclease/exonuclease/phosphatase family protein [Gammaproteobacteria bacterium]|nr:endonuclease/exonuclease/phosphatase family protein [Gammaproteobacteria bacterium]
MTSQRSRNWFAWLGLALCAFLLLGACLGLVAPYLAYWWIEFDIFSHFRIHFMAVMVVAGVALLSPRLWPFVLLLGLVATPVLTSALPGFFASFQTEIAAPDGETRLKVLTFNTWFDNDDWPAIETYLRKEDADIVVMMEFGPSKRPLLEKLKPLYPYQKDCISIGYCYLVLLSKQPFEDAGHKNKWEGPAYIWVRYGEALSGLTVIGTHLSRPPFAAIQLRQVKNLARHAREMGERIIVAGDFNATRWSLMTRAFEAESGFARLTSQPTWPTYFLGLPQLGIDHIFISEGVRKLSEPRSGEDAGSDHLPLSVHLSIKQD